MSYASDKLYNGYLRKNMPRIVTSVKPREIIVHLPCLTEHDREAIEAKNDMSGNFEAMKVLLSCMKRRENWPEQFIAALEECEHETIAAEIRAEYNKLRGINNSSPPPPVSAAANVVTAHVHPAPSAPHLPDPGPAANALPAQPALPTRDVPSEACETNPIQETKSHTQSIPVQPAAPVVEVTTSPEPAQVQAEPQTQAVVVPPPSPKLASTNPSPPPERVDFIPRNEPEENQEPDIVQVQDVPHEAVNIPQEAEENTEVPPAGESKEETCENDDSMETTTLVDQSKKALDIALDDNTTLIYIAHKPIVVEPEPVPVVTDVSTQSTTTAEEDSLTIVDSSIAPPDATEVSPVRSRSPMTNLDDLILTPEKAPVQETSPREEEAPGVVPVLEETPEPEKAQVFEIVQETEVTPSQPAEVENGGSDRGSVSEEEDICFSKPDVLVSVEPPDQNNTTMRSPSPDPAPYSGDSGRLEMSEVEKSAPSCLENGISHKQLGNDVSESPPPSLEEEDIEENIGHVAEEPSILNKEIQASLTEVSGEPIKEAMTTVPPAQENSLISDQYCCVITEEMSESPAHSLEEEDVEENIKHVEEEPPILNKEIQASLTAVSGEQIKEVITTIPLVPETTLISDQPCCPIAEDMSEPPAPSLEEEDVEENVGHVAEEPSILNKEIEATLIEDSREPIKEAMTTVPLVPEATLISDQSCCCPNAGDVFPAPSLDVEDVEENLTHVVEQPPISNQENQTPRIEETEEQALELTIPAPTIISDTSCYPDEQGISESPAPSLDVEDVRENVGHVAEEPSILNLEVQTQLHQINGESANEITTATEISAIALITNVEQEADRNLTQEVLTPVIQVNGEPAKEITPVPSKPAPATHDSHQPNDPLVDQKLPDAGNPAANRLNTRYILTAAGVGACALLIAWRFKH